MMGWFGNRSNHVAQGFRLILGGWFGVVRRWFGQFFEPVQKPVRPCPMGAFYRPIRGLDWGKSNRLEGWFGWFGIPYRGGQKRTNGINELGRVVRFDFREPAEPPVFAMVSRGDPREPLYLQWFHGLLFS